MSDPLTAQYIERENAKLREFARELWAYVQGEGTREHDELAAEAHALGIVD